jgi:predicted transcriptional regulator
MARMTIVLSDELEEKLRKEAARRFGLRKGSISRAVEEAVRRWIGEHSE